jgi:hypothetical protein
MFPNRNHATKPERLSKTTSPKEYLQPKSTGAEALFLIVCALRGAEAPLFHRCTCGAIVGGIEIPWG